MLEAATRGIMRKNCTNCGKTRQNLQTQSPKWVIDLMDTVSVHFVFCFAECVCVCVCVRVCICAWACMCACMCVCVSLFHTHSLSITPSQQSRGQICPTQKGMLLLLANTYGPVGREEKLTFSLWHRTRAPVSRQTDSKDTASKYDWGNKTKQTINSKVKSEQLNCWWGWQNTDLWKCTHQCDETHRNNSKHVLLTQIVFFGCKKTDRQQKNKEAKKRTDKTSMVLFFASFFFCYLSSRTQRRHFLSKALVYYCFHVLRHIGDISLNPF